MKPRNGWIKIYRTLLQSPIFTSEKGLKVWVWCLLKANHSQHNQYVGRILVPLSPGQFVFGRFSAAQELRMNQSTVRDWVKVLKDDKYIDIEPFNKFSVISIRNWENYQDSDTSSANRTKTKRQQKDTNKNDKNEKNISKILESVEKSVNNPQLPSLKETYQRVLQGVRA